jgi:hypothetical protein
MRAKLAIAAVITLFAVRPVVFLITNWDWHGFLAPWYIYMWLTGLDYYWWESAVGELPQTSMRALSMLAGIVFFAVAHFFMVVEIGSFCCSAEDTCPDYYNEEDDEEPDDA